MPSRSTPATRRVARLRTDWWPVIFPPYGQLLPGQLVPGMDPAEAAARAEFEVLELPVPDEGDAASPEPIVPPDAPAEE